MEIPGIETPPVPHKNARGRPPKTEPEAGADNSATSAGGTLHKLDAVRDRLEHLQKLACIAKESATEFSEAIEAVAEKARIDRGVLRAFVLATSGPKVEQKKAKAEQLALLFEEIGA